MFNLVTVNMSALAASPPAIVYSLKDEKPTDVVNGLPFKQQGVFYRASPVRPQASRALALALTLNALSGYSDTARTSMPSGSPTRLEYSNEKFANYNFSPALREIANKSNVSLAAPRLSFTF